MFLILLIKYVVNSNFFIEKHFTHKNIQITIKTKKTNQKIYKKYLAKIIKSGYNSKTFVANILISHFYRSFKQIND